MKQLQDAVFHIFKDSSGECDCCKGIYGILLSIDVGDGWYSLCRDCLVSGLALIDGPAPESEK